MYKVFQHSTIASTFVIGVCLLNKTEVGGAESTIHIALLSKLIFEGQLIQVVNYSAYPPPLPPSTLLVLPVATITMAIKLCNNISVREKEKARSVFS